jgi:tRNA modification GTPase
VDNKIEESEIKSFLEDDNNVHIVEISVKNNIGVDKISNIIKEMFYNDEIKYNDEVCISNVRHKTLLDEAKAHLEDVVNAVLADVPEDIYSVDMYISYAKLGEIIGMDTGEDVVNEIFSKFCMGK